MDPGVKKNGQTYSDFRRIQAFTAKKAPPARGFGRIRNAGG